MSRISDYRAKLNNDIYQDGFHAGYRQALNDFKDIATARLKTARWPRSTITGEIFNSSKGAVLEFIRLNPGLPPFKISKRLGILDGTVRGAILRLEKEEKIYKKHGVWYHTEYQPIDNAIVEPSSTEQTILVDPD